jgi:hypothetical protein
MESDQDPVPTYRIFVSFELREGQTAAIFKIYRNGVLVRTTVVYIEQFVSEDEEGGGGRGD